MNKDSTASSSSGKPNVNWLAWGRLLRLPNLFTVPGDAVAGAALAGGLFNAISTVSAGASVLLLYAGGLLLNDYFDADTDLRERPERPVPSGAVNPKSVLAVGMGMLATGIAVAWMGAGVASGVAALCLAVLVVAYDAGKQHLGALAALLMGLCRGGSVLVGALSAAPISALSPVVWLAVAVAVLYTLALTVVAAGETSGEAPERTAYAPGGLLDLAAVAVVLLAGQVPNRAVLTAGVLLIGGVECAFAARAARAGQIPTPALIGALVRIMITIQAAWIVFGLRDTGWTSILAVLAIMVLARIAAELASKRFYGS